MKTNKKAMSGFAIAMVLSLAVMQGASTKGNNDVCCQQLGAGCAAGAYYTEGVTSVLFNYASNTCLGTSSAMAAVGLGAIYLTATNPVGWGILGCNRYSCIMIC